jgi:hypothetical protein
MSAFSQDRLDVTAMARKLDQSGARTGAEQRKFNRESCTLARKPAIPAT